MISVIDTPNPDTKKFVFEKTIVSEGTKEFKKDDKIEIALVSSIFSINSIDLVFFDKDFISIRKNKDSTWDQEIPKILNILSKNITDGFEPLNFKEESKFQDDISKRIEEVLNDKIRPAVAMDGGDIRLNSYKDGVAEVMLKGACAGCPSSTVTLKHGVERMIKHYVPEVNSVEAVNIDE